MEQEEVSFLSATEIAQHLGEKELDRFLKLQELFETPGWKLLQEYAQAQAFAALTAGAAAQSWEQNRVQYGMRLVWDDISNMDTRMMNEFEQLALSNREDSEAEQELE